MTIVGLTGSIGMGKSTVSAMMRQMGIPVFDADAVVHTLMIKDPSVRTALAAAFPECVDLSRVDAVDRGALGSVVFGDPEKKHRLESILHPAVGRARQAWLRRCGRCPVVVCDIPLLFETGLHHTVDVVVVVSAPAFVQRQRVLRRAGMTPERFQAILNHQWPDAQKRRHGDVVLHSGGSLGSLRCQIIDFIDSFASKVR
jgi:dephospho-CoA kinase